ncbi:MAG: hypothetical protein VX778_00365, partial [Candidatus Thermoplasmatota archaeon]|nr:hypothetical protein [Candidatus Thermoplasmatota archaeon]
ETSMLGPSCTANAETIAPYSIISLGHTLLQPSLATESTLTIHTPDGLLIDSYEVSVGDNVVPSTPLEATINTLSTSFIQGELFDGSIALINDGSESELLRFTNTCRASYWVVDTTGNLVFDSLDQANCRNAELDVVVGASSQSTFALQSWAFVDEVGCSMLSGDYVVVAEVSEFGYASSTDVDYRRVQSVDCGTTSLPIPSLSILTDENDAPVFELEVTTMDEQTDIQWLEICKASVQLWNLDQTEKVLEKNVLCNEDERIDEAIRISSDDVLAFEIGDLANYDYQDAQYRVRIDLATDQNVMLEQTFTWPLVDEVEETVDDEQQPVEVGQDVFEIDGVWSGVLTSDGTCWMLENEAGTIHMLADSPLSAWTPERGTTGLYRAQEAPANAACLRFTAQSYTIIDVLVETPLIAEEPAVEDSVVVDVEQLEEQTIPEWAPQAVTVLTVSALLSMLAFAAFNNEAIRISTTMTGLWLLGLIGKTSET